MRRFPRLLQVLGVNSVPVVGVLAADWTEATALALYWCENVMVTFLVGLRIGLHRRATAKRGHFETGPLASASVSSGATAFFAGFKSLADLSTFLGGDELPDPEPPGRAVAAIRRVAGEHKAEDFAEFHRRQSRRERLHAGEWEEPLAAELDESS